MTDKDRNLGYLVICDYCGERHRFVGAPCIEAVEAAARRRGMIIDDEGDFCDKVCAARDAGWKVVA